MTSLPLTRLEAAHILDEYRTLHWHGGVLDAQALQHVLTGAAWDGCDVRPNGVTEETARRALDQHQAQIGRPPTARELYAAIGIVLTDRTVVAETIANTRLILAHAKERRDQDHRQLRADSDARRLRSA